MSLPGCSICHGESGCTQLAPMTDPGTGSPICVSCLEDLLRQEYLRDTSPDQKKILRRRIEDHLRKNPAALIEVGAMLGASGDVRVDDLL